jgi:DNA-binding transcriptional ArsR family regulator
MRHKGPADGEDEAESDALDRVFAALADPLRRSILRRLDGNELLVSDLAEPYDVSVQAVSRHIQVLVRAGLVTQQRTGRISRCRLDAGPILTAAVWINRYSRYWQHQFDGLTARLTELGNAKSSNKPASTTARRPRRFALKRRSN